MNTDAMASGARPVSEDEPTGLRADFADLRAAVIESTERTRADLIAVSEDNKALMATWSAEARATRSITLWIVAIAVGVASVSTGLIGLLLSHPQIIVRLFGS